MQRTVLLEKHKAMNGKLVDFHGWEMPLHYEAGIMKEHLAVRSSVGIFDVSHMGDFIIIDKSSDRTLQSLLTNDITSVEPGKCVYTHMPDIEAKIIDDLIVTKLGDGKYFCVPNASMIDIDGNWMKDNADIDLIDLSSDLTCLAVQGPNARELLKKVFGQGMGDIGKFEAGAYDYSAMEFVGLDRINEQDIE